MLNIRLKYTYLFNISKTYAPFELCISIKFSISITLLLSSVDFKALNSLI